MAVAGLVSAIGQGVGNTIGAGLQGYGQVLGTRAAREQVNKAMGENTALTEAERTRQETIQQPFISAGTRGLSELEAFRMREAGPYQAQTFKGVDMSTDPGVAYRMQRANKAQEASAGAQGQLFSGPQQKALAALNQDLASQEYGSAYDRQPGQFSDEETARREQSNIEADRTLGYDTARMGQLQGLTEVGQSASNTYGAASGSLTQQQLINQMMLRGQKADINATAAAAPWMAGGSAVSGGGRTASNMGSYFMSK